MKNILKLNAPIGRPADLQFRDACILGEGSSLTGNYSSKGNCIIDGEVYGDVRAKSITIKAKGKLSGNAHAQTIIVQGKVEGKLQGADIFLLDGSDVCGELCYRQLSVEFGSKIIVQARPATSHVQLFDDALHTIQGDTASGGR